jgi:hypothetical protein
MAVAVEVEVAEGEEEGGEDEQDEGGGGEVVGAG